MDHPSFHQTLGLAGIGTMNGGRRKGANAVLRSPRQRRKAYDKEAAQLVVAFRKRHPGVEPSMNEVVNDSLRKSDPAFDTLCRRMEDLADKWGV